jgi:glycosyltransferase involved in cell wall biosynthesis
MSRMIRESAPPLAVLQVVGGGLVGGMERVSAVLAEALLARGHRSTLLVMGQGGAISDAAAKAGVEVIVLDMPMRPPRSFSDVRRLAAGLVRVTREVASSRYDVVQTHLFKTALFATPVARLRRKVVVGGLHGLDANLRQRAMMRRLVKLQNAATCASAGLRRALIEQEGFPADKLVAVPNGLAHSGPLAITVGTEEPAIRPVPPDAVVIGTVGRLYPRKGQRRLVAAFREVAERVPQAHLVLVGGGPDRGAIEADVAAAGLTDRVHLVGEQAEPAPYLKGFDVMAVTSDFEGFGMVVVEAQLAGVPVVSCAPGGPEDLIVDGESGRQVPPDDLAQALVQAVTDPAARARWAAAARAQAATYTGDAMAAGYERLYQRLLDGGVRSTPTSGPSPS